MSDLKYLLCSKPVIDIFTPAVYSKPFKSGYDFDKDEFYFVALLDCDAVEKYYNEIVEPFNEKSDEPDIDFWTRECCAGSMDVTKITIKNARKNGLFVEIERKLNLTNEKNRALVIHNLSAKYGLTPIELINKIAL